jgi:putative transposase
MKNDTHSKRVKQLSFEKVNGWGGKRAGAGRPNLSGTPNHMKRGRVSQKFPIHITQKLTDEMPSLQCKKLYSQIRRCLKRARLFGMATLHFNVLSNHIHLIVEAPDNNTLARSMQSLGSSLGKATRKQLNAQAENKKFQSQASLRSKKRVFKGRYHLHILKTPTEVKNAMEYVLLNHSKHSKTLEHMTRFSSAYAFKEWKTLLGHRFRYLIADEYNFLESKNAHDLHEDVIVPPRSWLSREGWKRACG